MATGAEWLSADQRLLGLLGDGTIRLLSCEWLRARGPDFVVPRHQELPPEALLTPSSAVNAFNAGDRRIGVLSYGWLTRAHPDPRGERAAFVLPFLRSAPGLGFEALFWDFACVPEPDANGYLSEADLAQQQRAFTLMNALYASADATAVIRLTYMPAPRASLAYNCRPVDERGWCVFEMYAAMIVVGTETQGDGRHRTPKLLDATGGPVPQLVEAPTPEEFAARLDLAKFTMERDVARAKQYYLDYYLENGVGARAKRSLEQQQRAGRARKRRLRRILICWCTPFCAVGLGFCMGVVALPRDEQHDVWNAALVGVGQVLMVVFGSGASLVIQPDEARMIRRLAAACLLVSVVVGTIQAVLFAFQVGDCRFYDRETDRETDQDATNSTPGVAHERMRADQEDEDAHFTCALMANSIAFAVVVLVGATAFVPVVRSLYRTNPRAALQRIMTTIRAISCLGFVIAIVANTTGGVVLDDQHDWQVHWIGTSVQLILVLFFASLTHSNRRKMTAWLGELGSSGKHEREQAALAALVSCCGRDATVQDAAETFRLLPLEQLYDSSELPGSGTGSADAATLRERTHKAALGAPHSVFVSHSWHDAREAKWAALQAWAKRYEAEHGAPPMLWLDAACVAQDGSTDRSLALLPLYIAGCQRMVVLAGSTFVERLWCMIEIFCFLRMGGALERITVVPVIDAAAARVTGDWKQQEADAAKARFACFDVRNARCAKQSDTDRLLTCIEVGFGSHKAFNELVRRTFEDRTAWDTEPKYSRPPPLPFRRRDKASVKASCRSCADRGASVISESRAHSCDLGPGPEAGSVLNETRCNIGGVAPQPCGHQISVSVRSFSLASEPELGAVSEWMLGHQRV